MELAFETKQLRAICEIEIEAKRELKDAVAEILKHRLADLKAASSPKDLMIGRPRPDHVRNGMLLDLCDGYTLAFVANHAKNPRDVSGEVDWEKVSRIRIVAIERPQ